MAEDERFVHDDDDHVPAAAVRWILLHAVTSNVELARLTQVNQKWRRIVKEVLLEQAQPQAQWAVDGDNESMTVFSCCLNGLLLPSVLRHMLRKHHHAPQNHDNDTKTDDDDVDDTFCAAWFPPEGIQKMDVSLSTAAEEEDEDKDDIVGNGFCRKSNNNNHHSAAIPSPQQSEPFAPSGAQTYEGSNDDDEKEYRTRSRSRSRSPAASQQSLQRRWRQEELIKQQQRQQNDNNNNNNKNNDAVICTNEWRGYRKPMDVLQHFGYSSSFVNDLFETAIARAVNSSSSSSTSSSSSLVVPEAVKDDLSSSPKKNGASSSSSSSLPTMTNETTFAVRGATIARPESYCLCMDAADGVTRDKQQLQMPKVAETAATTTMTNGSGVQHNNNNNNNNWEEDIRFQEYMQSLIRRNKRRRQLQRDVLPRVLLSRNDDNNNNNTTYDSSSSRPAAAAGVQFLNADGSHAVCMTTPPFACGPLKQPVTIFCVAIATEDGCFLSGLHHRFELGHLYPSRSDTLAEASELSPVCIATTSWKEETLMTTLQQNIPLKPSNSNISCPFKFSSSDDDSSYDPDDASSSPSSDFGRCDCIFQGVCDKLNAVDDEDDDDDIDDAVKRLSIQRGRLGPGSWHCYVAIVDGKHNSLIRIDGIEEPLQLDDRYNGQGGGVFDQDASHAHAAAMLDGLTIGSDHCFGMSLCCGCVSGGEGEGAIGELAVFKGRLDLLDIQVLERQLMAKHGIPFVDTESSDMRWQEDRWSRHAEALLVQSDYCNGEQDRRIGNATEETRVPLRFLARHRSVAWRYTNPVTGEAALISKIGCRPGGAEESSDW